MAEARDTQAHLVAVSSAERDQARWPTPAEYCVDFDRPFQQVVGFDILDASLPASTYAVDAHNNTFRVGEHVGGTEAAASTPARLAELHGSATFARALDSGGPRDFRLVGDNAAFSGAAPATGTQTHLVFWRSVAATPFAGAAPAGAAPDLLAGGLELRKLAPGSFQWRLAAKAAAWQTLPVATVLGVDYAVAPLGGRAYRIDADALLLVPLSDQVEFSGGALTGRVCVQVSAATYAAHAAFYHEWRAHDVAVESASHSMDTLAGAIEQASPDVAGSPGVPLLAVDGDSAVAPADLELRRKLVLRSPSYFWADMGRSSARALLGFGERATSGRATEYERVAAGTHVFGAVAEASGSNAYALRTPGVVDLRGERFVRLRCRELEDHLPRPAHGTGDPGIALFKLGRAQALEQVRVDFANFSAATSAPVPKLSRLTLRFECTDDASLYDFKAVDHQIVLALRTLAPA